MTAPRTPAGRIAGAMTLVALFAATELLVFQLRPLAPATAMAACLGGFLGLVSLALEMGMQERAARTFHAQGVQTTFLSFMMRLAVVGPTTLLLMKSEIGLDPQAFALSYCSTFFLYLCWLTWVTYHAPVQYKPRARAAAAPAAPTLTELCSGTYVVRDNRRGVRATTSGTQAR